jgi:hypothetical protein
MIPFSASSNVLLSSTGNISIPSLLIKGNCLSKTSVEPSAKLNVWKPFDNKYSLPFVTFTT